MFSSIVLTLFGFHKVPRIVDQLVKFVLVVVLGIGFEAGEQVGILVLGDDGGEALGSCGVELVVADEGGQRLIGCGDVAFTGEADEVGTCGRAFGLQRCEDTFSDITVEGGEGGLCC